MSKAGRLVEAFSSVQGEGLWVGLRHLFLRLSGCNLRCAYCDTPAALGDAAEFIVRGGGREQRWPAALTAAKVWQALAPLQPERHHAVSLTGGEPLLQVEFLQEMLAASPPGIRFLLETNGTLPEAMAVLADRLDYISMDIKLPAETGGEYWEEHRRFLAVACSRPLAVKLVLTARTQAPQVERAVRLVADASPSIPLVLQPASPVPGGPAPPPPQALLDWQELAMNWLAEVRVIPQVHRQLALP